MNDYIKQLEEQNEELKQKLAEVETILYADGVRQTALDVFKKCRLPKSFEQFKKDTENMCNPNPEEWMLELAEYEFYYELGKRHKELRNKILEKFKDDKTGCLFYWEDGLDFKKLSV